MRRSTSTTNATRGLVAYPSVGLQLYVLTVQRVLFDCEAASVVATAACREQPLPKDMLWGSMLPPCLPCTTFIINGALAT